MEPACTCSAPWPPGRAGLGNLFTRGHRESKSQDAAFSEERESVQRRLSDLSARHAACNLSSRASRPPLAVAFSGGGQRAASVACGLLWALAEEGWLPHVSHISAVSGGSYAAAALATHIMGSESPPAGQDVNGWYLLVVAKCIEQFQNNISHLVNAPEGRWDKGVGLTLCFVFRTIMTLLLSTVMLSLYVVMPMTIAMVRYYSPPMRRAFCYPHPCVSAEQPELKFDPLFGFFAPDVFEDTGWLLRHLGLCFLVAAVARSVQLCSCCKQPPEGSPSRAVGFLLANATYELALRALFIGLAFVACVWLAFFLQFFAYGFASSRGWRGERARSLCLRYITSARAQPRCSDFGINYGEVGVRSQWFLQEGELGFPFQYLNGTRGSDCTDSLPNRFQLPEFFLHNLFLSLNLVILLALVASALIRSKTLHTIAGIVGPAWSTWVAASIATWKIFGPLTEQPLVPLFGAAPFSKDSDETVLFVGFLLVVCTLPFYNHIQQHLHHFNTDKLQEAYFERSTAGYELEQFAYRGETSNNSLYCPNMVIGAAVQDYGRPSDVVGHADFELTPLFLGGERTRYHSTSHTRCRLKTAMGVSAGAVDMAMSSREEYKVTASWWLGWLSLQMGAWVRVRPTPGCWERCRCLSGLREFVDTEELCLRLPGIMMVSLWYFFIFSFSRELPGPVLGVPELEESCSSSLLLWSLLGGLTMFLLALHLSFVPYVDVVFRSPVMRHVMLILKHQHLAHEIPEYLYLLDGGLVDCIGVVALLRRREKLILALDAASPAADSTRFIRECLQQALKERLCSFEDPGCPGRDWSYVVEDFARDDRATTLHLRVRYEPKEGQPPGQLAHVFIVRMWTPQDDNTLRGGLLSREELRCAGVGAGRSAPQWPRFYSAHSREMEEPLLDERKHLHGVCCFDCCHGALPEVAQRMCGTFPHVTMANQFLTRTLFAELCRLGRELGQDALEKVADLERTEQGNRSPQ